MLIFNKIIKGFGKQIIFEAKIYDPIINWYIKKILKPEAFILKTNRNNYIVCLALKNLTKSDKVTFLFFLINFYLKVFRLFYFHKETHQI